MRNMRNCVSVYIVQKNRKLQNNPHENGFCQTSLVIMLNYDHFKTSARMKAYKGTM